MRALRRQKKRAPRCMGAFRPKNGRQQRVPKKRSKPFKINGVGHFWETHLRVCFVQQMKNYAPMQRGVRFDICPFGTGASYTGPQKCSKPFKIGGLGCFREPFFSHRSLDQRVSKEFRPARAQR